MGEIILYLAIPRAHLLTPFTFGVPNTESMSFNWGKLAGKPLGCSRAGRLTVRRCWGLSSWEKRELQGDRPAPTCKRWRQVPGGKTRLIRCGCKRQWSPWGHYNNEVGCPERLPWGFPKFDQIKPWAISSNPVSWPALHGKLDWRPMPVVPSSLTL